MLIVLQLTVHQWAVNSLSSEHLNSGEPPARLKSQPATPMSRHHKKCPCAFCTPTDLTPSAWKNLHAQARWTHHGRLDLHRSTSRWSSLQCRHGWEPCATATGNSVLLCWAPCPVIRLLLWAVHVSGPVLLAQTPHHTHTHVQTMGAYSRWPISEKEERVTLAKYICNSLKKKNKVKHQYLKWRSSFIWPNVP